MARLVFRSDGNSIDGLGHLYRTFALIEMYKDQFECLILTRENTATNVIPVNYSRQLIPNAIPLDQEPEWITNHFSSKEDTFFLDGYGFTSTYQHQLKKAGFTLVFVDDFAKEHMYADIIINHSLSVTKKNYSAEPYSKFALGTKYAILRPLFLEATKQERVIDKIDSAFVCFGGADMFNLSYTACEALIHCKEIKKIHVVLGAAYSHQTIYDLEKKHSHLIVYKNLSERHLIDIIESCDFAIVPASTILYEVCAVKMPILAGYYVANQQNIYNGCVQNKLVYAGGNFEGYRVEHFEEMINKIIAEKNYQSYIQAQANLFDSRIKQRFLKLLVKIKYRRATSDDLLLVYNWANDKVSRANSYFSDEISLETHTAWFEKKLRDHKCNIYVAEIDGLPAGLVRYEIGEDNTVVGILVGENYRGNGFAVDFLVDTAKFYFDNNSKPVLAYIKVENIASLKSFEKAGYNIFKKEVVQDKPSLVYKLEKKDV